MAEPTDGSNDSTLDGIAQTPINKFQKYSGKYRLKRAEMIPFLLIGP